MIDGKKLFEQMLKFPTPWEVAQVKIDEEARKIKVYTVNPQILKFDFLRVDCSEV